MFTLLFSFQSTQTSTAYILFYHRRSSHRIDYLSLFDAEICKLEAKFNSTTCNPLEAEEGEKLEERNQQVADDGMENEIRAKRKRKARGGGNKRKRRKGNKRKERKGGKKRKNKRGRKKRKVESAGNMQYKKQAWDTISSTSFIDCYY